MRIVSFRLYLSLVLATCLQPHSLAFAQNNIPPDAAAEVGEYTPAGPMVEVLGGDKTTGTLEVGTLVGGWQVRSTDSIVLNSDIKQGGIFIPAGSTLFRVESVENVVRNGKIESGRIAWCNKKAVGSSLVGGLRLDCLEEDEAHKYVYYSFATLTARSRADVPFDIKLLSSRIKLDIPASTRIATTEELPVAHIGYRLCNDPKNGAALRFSGVIRTDPGDWVGLKDDCNIDGIATNSSPINIKIDRVELQIGTLNGISSFSIIKDLPKGPLAPLKIEGPFYSSEQRPIHRLPELEIRSARPLRPSGAARLGAPRVERGGVVVEVPVVHGVTGVLYHNIKKPGVFLPDYLSAGQYMFGLPMNNSGVLGVSPSQSVTWCAPRSTDGGISFSTVCFIPYGDSYLWTRVGDPLMPMSMQYSISKYAVATVDDLVVDRRSADLGAAMTFTLVFGRWVQHGGPNEGMVAELGSEIRTRSQVSALSHVEILAAPDGRYRLPIMGGVIEIMPIGRDGVPAQPLPSSASHEAVQAYWAAIDLNKAAITVAIPLRSDGQLPYTGAFRAIVSAPTPPSP